MLNGLWLAGVGLVGFLQLDRRHIKNSVGDMVLAGMPMILPCISTIIGSVGGHAVTFHTLAPRHQLRCRLFKTKYRKQTNALVRLSAKERAYADIGKMRD